MEWKKRCKQTLKEGVEKEIFEEKDGAYTLSKKFQNERIKFVKGAKLPEVESVEDGITQATIITLMYMIDRTATEREILDFEHIIQTMEAQ